MSGLKNLDKAVAKLGKFKGRVEQIMKSELYKEAEGIMTLSKEAFVPVDQGPLRASGQVDEPVVNFGVIDVTLGYGNAAVEYAKVVHEDMAAFHPTGQAKYLEIPFKMEQPGVKGRLAKTLINEAKKL